MEVGGVGGCDSGEGVRAEGGEQGRGGEEPGCPV